MTFPFPGRLLRAVLLLAAAATTPAVSAAATVQDREGTKEPPLRIVLASGAVLEAPARVEEDGAVVVDLGFDTLRVPADQVVARDAAEPSGDAPARAAVPVEADGAPLPAAPVELELDGRPRDAEAAAPDLPPGAGPVRLWHAAEDPKSLPLDDAVKAVGEAVVLVRTPIALGSGFVVHPEGYVVTNDHVIEGSNELTVILFRQATDGLRKDEYKKVRVVATAELLDLALLKLETDDDERFATVPLGDSHAVTQGEPVFAVGNPLGLERTLSEGIVALRSRLLSGQSYVQTTAALSPGNSGGPLFNRRGEVLGVNSLKIVAQGAEGLSFSIPVNRVKAFLDDQEAYAFDPLNPNTGYRYYAPPEQPAPKDEEGTVAPQPTSEEAER